MYDKLLKATSHDKQALNRLVLNNIKQLCQQHNISLRALGNTCHINHSTFTHMRTAHSIDMTTLLKVANYFKVSVDWLLSNHNC